MRLRLLKRRLWARLLYENRWYRKLQQGALLCTTAGLILFFLVLLTLRRIHQAIELDRIQVVNTQQQATLPPEVEALHQQIWEIADRLQKAPNPNGYVIGELSTFAQQETLQVLSVDISDSNTPYPDATGWQKRLFRLRLRGNIAGLQRWLDKMIHLPLLLYPTGLYIDTKEKARNRSSELMIITEFQVLLPVQQEANKMSRQEQGGS